MSTFEQEVLLGHSFLLKSRRYSCVLASRINFLSLSPLPLTSYPPSLLPFSLSVPGMEKLKFRSHGPWVIRQNTHERLRTHLAVSITGHGYGALRSRVYVD